MQAKGDSERERFGASCVGTTRCNLERLAGPKTMERLSGYRINLYQLNNL